MTPYIITPNHWFIRERARTTETEPSLGYLFQDSHTLFKQRIHKLGDLQKITTEEDSVTLLTMLEALIAAKKQLQSTLK